MIRAFGCCAAVLVLCLLIGCGECPSPANENEGTNELDSVAFAVIGGKPLTASFVKDVVLIQAKIAELARKPVSARAFTGWANNLAMKITPGLISAEVLDTEIQQRGIVPTTGDVARVLANYNRRIHGKAADLDQLAKRFGELEPQFRRMFERDCRFSAFFSTAVPTEEEIAEEFQSASNTVEACQQINERAKLRVQEAWEKLNAGVEWATVAAEFTEDEKLDPENRNFCREWGVFKLQEMGIPEVRESLPRLSVGGFSRPLDIDEGFVIVRLLEKKGDSYRIARILIRAAYEMPTPTREEIVEIIRRAKIESIQRELIPQLRKKAGIKYPLGTNFLYRIWTEPAAVENKPSRRNIFAEKAN